MALDMYASNIVRRRDLFIKLSLLSSSLIVGLTVAEFIMRISGIDPGPLPAPLSTREIQEHETLIPPFRHSGLKGWELRPGNYTLSSKSSATPLVTTILADGNRVTMPQIYTALPAADAPTVLFLGDAYTFGEGLNDNETLPWKLRELLPTRRVLNFGVGGYGGCQTLMHLRELMKNQAHRDSTVIYGFSGFHQERNMADPRQDYWIALASPWRTSLYPRCSLSGGQLLTEPAKVWDVLMPFTGQLALSRLASNALLEVLASEVDGAKRSLTAEIVRQMKLDVEHHSARFVVLLEELSPEDLDFYRSLLNRLQIAFVDGSAAAADAELKLSNGLPGPQMTERWAKQVAEFLNEKPS